MLRQFLVCIEAQLFPWYESVNRIPWNTFEELGEISTKFPRDVVNLLFKKKNNI